MDFGGFKLGLKFGRPGRVANKRYKYVPRYYDEDKSDLDYRVARARRDRDRFENHASTPPGNSEDRMRKAMEFRTNAFNTEFNSMNRFAAVRTILIAAILVIIFYLLFSHDLILRIFDAFYNE
jgi:hypothetical protein